MTALLGAMFAIWPSFSLAATQQFQASSEDAAKMMTTVDTKALIIVLIVELVLTLIIYAYFAICLMKIAKKTGTDNAWMAWLPILNFFLMVNVSGKSLWWFLLLFIPIVNIIILVIIWMAIAKRLGKPEWLGILMIVPIANLIVPGYLAFSSSEVGADYQQPTQPQEPQQPQL